MNMTTFQNSANSSTLEEHSNMSMLMTTEYSGLAVTAGVKGIYTSAR
jgi:hypothetical protein